MPDLSPTAVEELGDSILLPSGGYIPGKVVEKKDGRMVTTYIIHEPRSPSKGGLSSGQRSRTKSSQKGSSTRSANKASSQPRSVSKVSGSGPSKTGSVSKASESRSTSQTLESHTILESSSKASSSKAFPSLSSGKNSTPQKRVSGPSVPLSDPANQMTSTRPVSRIAMTPFQNPSSYRESKGSFEQIVHIGGQKFSFAKLTQKIAYQFNLDLEWSTFFLIEYLRYTELQGKVEKLAPTHKIWTPTNILAISQLHSRSHREKMLEAFRANSEEVSDVLTRYKDLPVYDKSVFLQIYADYHGTSPFPEVWH